MRHWAEEVVRDALLARGWTLLEENAVLRRGELDLVMRDGPTIVAVEVRQRSRSSYGDASETIGPRKLARLRAAVRAWSWRRYGTTEVPMRIDAALVRGPRGRCEVEVLHDVG